MPRGRKPKPTALKLLEGNPGKRKINKKEPKPRTVRAGVPEEFTIQRALPGEDIKGFRPPLAAEVAAQAFKRLYAELKRMNLLTDVDVEMLSAYCQAYGLWKEATAMVNKLGLVTSTLKGNMVQNPFVPIVNRQAQIMAKLASEFGFSPSSRSRLEVDTNSGEDDPLEQLLARRHKA